MTKKISNPLPPDTKKPKPPPNTPPITKDWPRRIRRDMWVPAERAIQDAVDVVEGMGCDTRLTDAVILLSQARAKVADFIDGVK